jgi:lipopolysaccharide transport system ATP-binding protein
MTPAQTQPGPSHRIALRDVDLVYSSLAFKERSLKTLALRTLARRPAGAVHDVHDVHALKGLNLEIGAGERVGLLGHNGAGKTSLLKVLAGLYPIAAGSLRVQGQVRALFDLSLGFEPDASGRENILYRGLLLGLNPAFMRRMENEIVAFADLGEFIDYPVKTYSAGMQVRLAFAISTAVGGDVLLLDEVIGAGDEAFMKKARERIRSLIDQAEILVLASHDITSLRSLCERGLVLDHGKLVFDGPIDAAVAHYRSTQGAQGAQAGT